MGDTDDSLDQQIRRQPSLPLQDNLGMGPVKVAAPMGGPSLVPPIGRPVSDTGVPMYNQRDEVPATGTAKPANQHIQELQRLNDTGSGVQQVQQKHPFWGGVLRGLDVAGSIINPAITSQIPGTTLHHNQLIHQQEGLANQDVVREERQAQTGDLEAQTQQRLHPPPVKETPEEKAYDYEVSQGKNPTEAFGSIKQTAQDVKPVTPEQEEMEYATLRNQAGNGTLNPEQQARLNDLQTRFSVGPQGAQQIEGRILGELNANPHTKATTLPPELHVLPTDTLAEANAKYNAAKDRVGAATGQQHIAISVANQGDKGAQSIFVPVDPKDPSKGYQLQYVKPGQSVGAGGVTSGGMSGQSVANDKALAGGSKAIAYANDYMQKGIYTGPGDEALMDQFFSVAKPDSGFRMTTAQQDMFKNSRSWMQSAEGQAYHALTGTWFTDNQRKQIVDTMNNLKGANDEAHGGGTSAPTGASTKGVWNPRTGRYD